MDPVTLLDFESTSGSLVNGIIPMIFVNSSLMLSNSRCASDSFPKDRVWNIQP